jgi:hypothetical protein
MLFYVFTLRHGEAWWAWWETHVGRAQWPLGGRLEKFSSITRGKPVPALSEAVRWSQEDTAVLALYPTSCLHGVHLYAVCRRRVGRHQRGYYPRFFVMERAAARSTNPLPA